jgi:hypothetical protein
LVNFGQGVKIKAAIDAVSRNGLTRRRDVGVLVVHSSASREAIRKDRIEEVSFVRVEMSVS